MSSKSGVKYDCAKTLKRLASNAVAYKWMHDKQCTCSKDHHKNEAHNSLFADQRYGNISFAIVIVVALASYASGGTLLANLRNESFEASLASAVIALVIGAFLSTCVWNTWHIMVHFEHLLCRRNRSCQ